MAIVTLRDIIVKRDHWLYWLMRLTFRMRFLATASSGHFSRLLCHRAKSRLQTSC